MKQLDPDFYERHDEWMLLETGRTVYMRGPQVNIGYPIGSAHPLDGGDQVDEETVVTLDLQGLSDLRDAWLDLVGERDETIARLTETILDLRSELESAETPWLPVRAFKLDDDEADLDPIGLVIDYDDVVRPGDQA